MRAVDGVVVVVDAVEGCMPQTETVIRQALKERVKPVLFINKSDRLIKELRLEPAQMQEQFTKIIFQVNELINKYIEEDLKDKWTVSVQSGSVAFGSAVQNWALSVSMMQKTGMNFAKVKELIESDKVRELADQAPLHEVVLDMVVKHLPNPLVAQKYRIPKIWAGDLESETGKSMLAADPKGKLGAVVTKIYTDPHAGFVATVRIFSGSMKSGQEVWLIGQGRKQKVQQVAIYKGQQRIQMDEVKAGNIVGVVGITEASSGETLCDPENPIQGFEAIQHLFEPVVTKAIEPKKPKDLEKFIQLLRKTSKEDPGLRININEDTGEYLISGLGELHLDAKIERPLKDAGIEVEISPPIVIYHESVEGTSPEPVEGKSPNKHNRFYVIATPVEPDLYKAMVEGKVSDSEVKRKDQELVEALVKYGMDRDQAKRVKLIFNKNILIDATTGVTAILEIMEMVKEAFTEAMKEGPLAREPCSGVKILIVDASLHEDAIHRGPAQVIPPVRSAVRDAMVTAKAYVMEPKQMLRIDVPTEQVGGALKEVQNRRGHIADMKEEAGATVLVAKVPVAEMFGFNSALKSSTGGRGFFWMVDILYEPVPKAIEKGVVDKIRQRKGIGKEEEKEE